jgi:peptide deformylase
VPIQLAVIDVAHAAELQSYFRVDGREAVLADFMPLVFLNPRLEPGRGKITDTEGCLSFPGVRYQISRFSPIKAHLTLLDGREIVIETDGLLSRALQHETDHLHGRLFIDRLSAADKLGLKKRLQQMYGEIDNEMVKKPERAMNQ